MTCCLNLAAVIGCPVAHSRSPRLHTHWLHRYRIDGQYIPLHVETADFETTIKLLPRIGFVGANVTIPHKGSALRCADHVSDVAKRIGAANTLAFGRNGVEADNTDAFGFARNIQAQDPDWTPRVAAVIGSGGASRAVIVALIDLGAAEIRLTNRTDSRAQELADEFGSPVKAVPWTERSSMLAGCDTLVNTTSLGMLDQPPLPLDLSDLPDSALVNDLVYTPLETPLLAAARRRQNRCVDGLGMLLHQAAPAFEKWFHVKPEVDDTLRKAVLT